MGLVYDVAHNIAKIEEHEVAGRRASSACIARAPPAHFPPAMPKCPSNTAHIGQPVIIPGDMGRASWVLVGQPGQHGTDLRHHLPRRRPRDEPHGRRQARPGPPDRPANLAEQGMVARCRSWKGLAEEPPAAYKDVSLVVDVVHRAGLANKVARCGRWAW